MDTDFLRTILPESTDWFQLVRIDKREDGRSRTSHFPLKISASNRDYTNKLEWITSPKVHDGAPVSNGIFFTPWSFDVDKVTEAEAGGPMKGRSPRKHDSHKVTCRALWLDVDVKEGGHYETEAAALTAVLEACGPRIPKPTAIVATGGGYHFYWVLAEALQLVDWQQTAARFDQYWKDAGVKFDPISCDSARVLRVPGTDNMKTGDPRECKTIHRGSAISNGWIDRWPEAEVVLPDAPLVITNALFPAGTDHDLGTRDHGPRYTAEVIKECELLRTIATDGGAGCTDPLWHAVLQFNRHTEDGTQYNVLMSQGHADYTPEGTAAKVASLDQTVKPITCTQFRTGYMNDFPDRADPCARCQHSHNEKIRSPLAVGRKPEEVRAAAVAALKTTGALLPGNLIPKNGEFVTYATVPGGKKDAPPKEVRVLGVELVAITSTDLLEKDSKVIPMLTFEYRHSVRGADKAIISLTDLTSRDAFKTLAGSGLSPAGENEAQTVGRYAMNWSSKLNETAMSDTSYARQGWHGDACDTFVVADQILRADGNHSTIASPSHDTPPVKGTLKDWQGMATALLAADNPAFRIALAASFGTPLSMLCPDSDGMAGISFYSNESGVGKSTAMKVAAAIWGPADNMASGTDTKNGVQAAAGVRPHTPLIWDDPKSDAIRRHLTDLVFEVVHGRGKQRATNTGAAAAVREFNTLMMITSNAPFHGQLDVEEGEGVAARLMEMEVPSTAKQATDAFRHMKDVSGAAGVAFMSKVVTNRPEVRALYKGVAAAVASKLQVDGVDNDRERFYKRTASLAVTGAMLAKQWGISDLDPAAVMQDFATLIVEMREGVQERMKSGSIEALVWDFMSDRNVHGGVCTLFKRQGHMAEDPVTILAPPLQLQSHWGYTIATEEKAVRVSKTAFREWWLRTDRGTFNARRILGRADAEGVLGAGHRKGGRLECSVRLSMSCGDAPYPNKKAYSFEFHMDSLEDYDSRDLRDRMKVVPTPDASSSELPSSTA